MAMEGAEEDMGDGTMQCMDHPYKNTTPGAICAFCLQEKLGKLVSSSFPIAVFPTSSPSSPPSFRSDFAPTAVQVPSNTNSSSSQNNCHCRQQYYSRRSRILFLLTHKKKKDPSITGGAPDHAAAVFKRSKSTATPRRGPRFSESDEYSRHQKRGFWSFFYPSLATTSYCSREKKKEELAAAAAAAAAAVEVEEEEEQSPNPASLGRKVSRSRSVGCGSRSFSGDFFERISTGFGDCTLRRVESQREAKPKVAAVHGGGRQDGIKERVKCGGLFGGFMIASSSSASSSSSSYWVSTSTEDKMTRKAVPPTARHLSHGRSRSWGWPFASPIRAFGKPSGKREASNKNSTPNLAAIPSLLAVRG